LIVEHDFDLRAAAAELDPFTGANALDRDAFAGDPRSVRAAEVANGPGAAIVRVLGVPSGDNDVFVRIERDIVGRFAAESNGVGVENLFLAVFRAAEVANMDLHGNPLCPSEA